MPKPSEPTLNVSPADFEALLDYLRRTRNFDIGGYKRTGLLRRLHKRMRAAGVTDLASYISHLDTHPDEFVRLLNTLLINVTAFFRDDLPWEYLRAEVLPRLVDQKPTTDPIRVWCAGCATGEEAYTLAMVLAEQLGDDAFRTRVKIYATDLDDDALAQARQGSYTEADVADVPEALRERYFEHQEARWVFRKDLRRQVIFGRNDLLSDAPISRIDLLACRNTLMHFDAATQAKILAGFHFALNDDGVLCLGRAETLPTHGTMFTPLDLRRRVFVKVPRFPAHDRHLMMQRPAVGHVATKDVAPLHERDLQAQAFDTSTVAQFVVDRENRLAMVSARARALFHLGAADIGRPLQDLEVSYRPFELRSLIDQAYSELRTVTRTDVPWRAPGGEQRWFEIIVAPLVHSSTQPTGASVSFVEVTRYKLLQQQIEDSQAELEAACQELQSTSEELETTSEELHSTVEELETTNEELQRTSEELETMNEELQSTNEELQTIDDELRLRSDELDRVNAFVESVLASLGAGIAVLDRDLRVLEWNGRAEDLWGLRADEVERASFINLDIGLPVASLVQPLRAVLSGSEPQHETVIPCTNRRGQPIDCRVTITSLHGAGDDRPHGVIVIMHEQPASTGEAEEGRGTRGPGRETA